MEIEIGKLYDIEGVKHGKFSVKIIYGNRIVLYLCNFSQSVHTDPAMDLAQPLEKWEKLAKQLAVDYQLDERSYRTG